MLTEICPRIILACGLVTLLGLRSHTLSQSLKPSPPKSHSHLRAGKSAVGIDIPEFSMAVATLEAGVKKENLIADRHRRYAAFTVNYTRLFVEDRGTGKLFEIHGLPLGRRPFTNLIWANGRTLMFDRWSQPHYGIHYAVNVQSGKLIDAAPFPDKFFLEQQRPGGENRQAARRGATR
jgi:hypothetical protein